MATAVALQIDRDSFPLVDCGACGRRSLTYLDALDADADLLRCLGCDAPVSEAAIRPAGAKAVEALGYVFIDRARKVLAKKALSGCGTKGVKSCGTGGCSSGGCGTGGGSCGTGGGCGSKT